jgi:hypothetical protein
MTYSFEFKIDELPLTTNAQTSMHWKKKGQYVKYWHQLVFYKTGKDIPMTPLKRAKLTLTRMSSREPDFDGLVSCFKPVIDALVVCGILENDKMSNIGKSEYLWEKVSNKNACIKVKIEELI